MVHRLGEARTLIWQRRGRLAFGLLLTLIARVSGLVLPATSKVLIDSVIGQGRHDLLTPLALAAGAATVVQAITSFLQSQVLGIAAQRAITEMRRQVHEHIMRLPVGYFDKTQSGILISRVMTDAEGIRNLVGTGLVQLFGSLITAVLALGVLLYLNWRLTLITIVVLAAFGGIMGYAFKYLRPMFRERGKLAGGSHRPARAVARRHPRGQGLHRRETRGNRLREGRARDAAQRREDR